MRSPSGVLRGVQMPRLFWVPPRVSSATREALELAAWAGLVLDPWQQLALDASLGERADGLWTAFEIGLLASRRSGKSEGVVLARELAGLFLFNEQTIIHSAHNFDTAMRGFVRLDALIQGRGDLSRRVKRRSQSHGAEGFALRTGAELRFRTRTGQGGRGWDGDLVVLDEAMYLTEPQLGALMPVVTARPNPQIWYVGSAVDKFEHPGKAFARIRKRGLDGGDEQLAWCEWSAPGTLVDYEPLDRQAWAASIPALGYRISEERVASLQRSMPRRQFAVEMLGIGDWPSVEDETKDIDPAAWKRAAAPLDAPAGHRAGPVALAVETHYAGAATSIGRAYVRADGARQIDLIDRAEGKGWVPGRIVELVDELDPCAIVIDPAGPAGEVIPDIAGLGIEVTTTTARQVAQACGGFQTALTEERLRHPDEPLLNDAAGVVTKRPLGDLWAWERRNLQADIAPLMAVTLALWGLTVHGKPRKPTPQPQAVESTSAQPDIDLASIGF